MTEYPVTIEYFATCRLEAEIKEAQLKAKEEMMQGIQIVKEMAQQELSSQKAVYESKIKVLEAELVRGRTVFFLCRCRAPGERQRGDQGCWAAGRRSRQALSPSPRAALPPRSPSGGQRSERFD